MKNDVIDGFWTEHFHRKISKGEFNDGMVRYIIENMAPESVFEFGSGLGYMAKMLNDTCTTEPVHCVEPMDIDGEYNQVKGPKLFATNVFADTIPEELDRVYDLVLSIEVAEHIERSRHDELFDFLVAKTNDWIVFSAARIGQPGRGHIACRDHMDWRSEFLKRGMTFQEATTDEIRVSCNERNQNHKQNIQVFRKER